MELEKVRKNTHKIKINTGNKTNIWLHVIQKDGGELRVTRRMHAHSTSVPFIPPTVFP